MNAQIPVKIVPELVATVIVLSDRFQELDGELVGEIAELAIRVD